MRPNADIYLSGQRVSLHARYLSGRRQGASRLIHKHATASFLRDKEIEK